MVIFRWSRADCGWSEHLAGSPYPTAMAPSISARWMPWTSARESGDLSRRTGGSRVSLGGTIGKTWIFSEKTWIFLQDFLPTNRMKWDLSSGSGKRGLCVDHLPRACGAINMHRQTARSLSEQEELLKVWAKKRSSIFSKTWILWWCWSLHNWYALGTLPTQPTDVQRYQLFNILPFPEKTTMHFFQISNFLGEKRNQTDGFCIGKIWTNATCCFSWHVDGRRTHPVVFMLGTTCHPCTVGLSRDAAAPMIFFGALCVGPGLNFIPTNNGYTYHLVI